MPKKIEFPAGKLSLLADKHITQFQNRISSHHPAVRVDECQKYLAIWQDIKDLMAGIPDEEMVDIRTLKPAEFQEIVDAWADGGYESLLGKY